MTEEKRKRGRPATGTTPLRNIRIGDELWEAAKASAKEHEETVSALIIRAIERELHRLRRANK